MPVNLEIKVKVKNFDLILAGLKKIKAKKSGLLHQKDVYFSTSKGLLKLRKEGKSQQLIRYQRDEKGKNRWSNFEILELRQVILVLSEQFVGHLFDFSQREHRGG